MKKRITNLLTFLLLGAILTLTACMPIQENNTPTLAIEDIGELALLIEGRIVPQQWAGLAFSGAGLVEESIFAEGDAVKAGDIIARLSGRTQLAASLAAAELELLTASQAYQALAKNHALAKAQALANRITLQQAIETAEISLENLKNKDLDIEIARAQANIVLLEEQLEEAQDRYDDYEDTADTDLSKAEARLKLTTAQHQLEEGRAMLNSLEKGDQDLAITKAESELALLKEQLSQALTSESELKDGPSPDALALAQQRLSAAQAGVDAAKDALESLDLVAPFDGIILENALKAGQFVMAGQQTVILADTSQWLVETNDLTEIDRARVRVGQAVTVTPDALPDAIIKGTVLQISDYYQENRGDITYKTTMQLAEPPAGLHWGMTVLITFEAE